MKQRPGVTSNTIFKPSLIAACVAQSLASFSVHAATIQPDNTQDLPFILIIPPGELPMVVEVCSLREAIVSINNGALELGCVNTGDVFGTNDRVINTFAANFPLYSELPITTDAPLTIDLVGSTITGAGTHRILDIAGTPNLSLNNMTISNGVDDNYNTIDGGGLSIRNSTVTINNSTISENSATIERGGGISAVSSTLTINNSSISSNYGYRGGGIYISGNSSLHVNNSTLNNNFSQKGGGVYQGLGLLTLSNSTVSNNSAVVYGGGLRINGSSNTVITHTTLHGNSAGTGSSIYSFSADYADVSISITNSVIADSPTNQECRFYDSGYGVTTFIDGGGNWFEDDTCNGVAQGEPRLGALADNGGPTQTHLPSLFSPVRNLATANCLATDQRGKSRGAAICDAGAAEFINAEIIVDSPTDDGTDCTLRDALASTSSAGLQPGCVSDIPLNDAEGRSILFDPSLAGETIMLGGFDLSIVDGQVVEINPTGVEGISIDGNRSSQVFRILNSEVSLNRLKIVNGYEGGVDTGGGIASEESSIVLTETTVSGNTAGFGGGISIFGGSIEIESSTISSNYSSSSDGGGIRGFGMALTMVNSTVSNNSTEGSIPNDGSGMSIGSNQPMSITNSTVANDLNVILGGDNVKPTLSNTIVDGTCQASGAPFVIEDQSGNIFRDASCNGAAQGDPGLMPLAGNGGPTQTHALRESSIARNAGLFGLCPLLDQRSNVRDEGDGKCDAGAFELLNTDIPVNFITIPLPNGKAVVVPL